MYINATTFQMEAREKGRAAQIRISYILLNYLFLYLRIESNLFSILAGVKEV